MEEKVLNKAKSWASSDLFPARDRLELQNLLDNLDLHGDEVEDRFYKDLEFGTGGLRAKIGHGSNRINAHNIQKACVAIAKTLKRKHNTLDQISVAISFDCRQFSSEFAQIAAISFAMNDIKVYLFKELTPTPLLSYALRHLKCQGGVMITASHNPKEYNGLKAYDETGAQVTPPMDQEIIKEFNLLQDIKSVPQIIKDDFQYFLDQEAIIYIQEEIEQAYFQSLAHELASKPLDNLHVVYSPLHGTGLKLITELAKRQQVKTFSVVHEESPPDGLFSSLHETSPNPEDPRAMKRAHDLMLKNKADLAYATDPDTDRLGVIINHQGKAVFLNGNELGTLLLVYLIDKRLSEKPGEALNYYVLKTIVTSSLQNMICQYHHLDVKETLTGFKWMAREINQRPDEKKLFFSSEESYGYMPFDFVRDKDAIAAAALVNEMTSHYKNLGLTLVDQLESIYKKYGRSKEDLISLTLEGIKGANLINQFMEKFRQTDLKDFGELFLERRDYLTKKVTKIDQSEDTLFCESSNVLGLIFKKRRLYLRPSGTEPKIKFYLMSQADSEDNCYKALRELRELIVKTLGVSLTDDLKKKILNSKNH